MHWMTSEGHWTLKSQKYYIYTKYLSPTSSHFSRYKVVENRKCTEWRQSNLERLAAKTILYTQSSYTRGQNLDPFGSKTSHFSTYKFVENRKNRIYTGWLPNDLKCLNVESTLYTLSRPTNSRGVNFGPFPGVLEIKVPKFQNSNISQFFW